MYFHKTFFRRCSSLASICLGKMVVSNKAGYTLSNTIVNLFLFCWSVTKHFLHRLLYLVKFGGQARGRKTFWLLLAMDWSCAALLVGHWSYKQRVHPKRNALWTPGRRDLYQRYGSQECEQKILLAGKQEKTAPCCCSKQITKWVQLRSWVTSCFRPVWVQGATSVYCQAWTEPVGWTKPSKNLAVLDIGTVWVERAGEMLPSSVFGSGSVLDCVKK